MISTAPFPARSLLSSIATLSALFTVICPTSSAQPATRPDTQPATQPTSSPATGPATRPITTARSPVGDLLRQWWKEGTAAGNVGDIYDNRDRTHSELNRAPYPQLEKYQYTKAQLDARADWAAQHTILRGVVFGNSSTSAPITMGGSNVRMYYSHPRGLPFLFAQYVSGNIYIYPEHQDHDPGHNGLFNGTAINGGHGDVYPTNTPYLITSQGSSGSDQPFMRAIPFTLAAFRPEVKKALVENGLLMPTLQMILRSTMKNVKNPDDYLTGIAHPTVFEGSNVDDLKMVKLAHEITLQTLPPMVALRVEEEDTFENGRDFFELPGAREQLADTPCAVARIWRAAAGKRRMVVAAAVDKLSSSKPIKFHWSILRGDDKRITIKPLNEAGSRVEITLSYHERRPIAPGSPLESMRVDLAAFAHNGAYWSPPAFVTFFSIDSEARVYGADGKILEIGYGVGSPRLSVSNWKSLLDAMLADEPNPGPALLRTKFKPEDLAAMKKIFEDYRAKLAAKDDKAANQLIDTKQPGLSAAIKPLIESTLNTIVVDESFQDRDDVDAAITRLLAKGDAKLKSAHTAAIAKLVQLGLATPGKDSARPQLKRDLNIWEKCHIQRYNADLISQLLLANLVNANKSANYVDPNLSRPKTWRDIYHYDKDNKLTGWTRLGLDKPYDFTPDGKVILEKDPAGQPKTAAVRYETDAPKPGQRAPNWSPLRQVIAN